MSFDDPLNAIKEETIVRAVSRLVFTGKVFLVGGAIRELLLGKLPKDYDFALTSQEDLRVFEGAFGARAFLLGKKPIQTHRIVAGPVSLDLTVLKGTIEEDLARRDFTMNAMAYDVKQHRIIDPLGGIEDVGKGIIKCANEQALHEDPLRMVKAVRHLVTLEGFSMDGALMESIRLSHHLIQTAAPERIKYEVDQIVVSARAYKGLLTLHKLGLLFELFPELRQLEELDREKGFALETFGHTLDGFKYLTHYAEVYTLEEREILTVAYALLFHDIGKAYTFSRDAAKNAVHFYYHEKHSCELATRRMESLRFSSNDMRAITKLIDSHMRIFLISNADSTDKALRRIVYKMGDLTPALIVLTLCDLYGSSGGRENDSTQMVRQRCDDLITTYHEWKKKPLQRLVNGHQLLALGFSEGPLIGKVLNEIRDRQLNGDLTTEEEAIAYARNRLNN